jgi:hypothetical protein
LNGSIPGMLKSKISKSQAEQPAKIRDLIEKKWWLKNIIYESNISNYFKYQIVIDLSK